MKTRNKIILLIAPLMVMAFFFCLIAGFQTPQQVVAQGMHAGLTDEADENACLKCHGAMKDKWLASAHRKAAQDLGDADAKGCLVCHKSKNGRELIANPTKAGKLAFAEICGKCHGGLNNAAPAAWKKVPIPAWKSTKHYRKDISCDKCHTLHQDDSAAAKKSPKEKCLVCHATLIKGAYVHTPVKNGQCLDCHATHGEGLPFMLRRDVGKACANCHDTSKPEIIKSHKGFNVAGADCIGCHNPHAQTAKGKHVRPNTHAPFKSGACKTCHNGPDVPEPLGLKKPAGELCATCHSDIAQEAAGQSAAHFPVKEGLCTKCHSPHVSSHQTLLKGRSADLCVTCHKGVGAQLSGVFAHPPVADGECKDCHKSHGSKIEKMLKEDPDELCKKCHPNIKFSHPMVPQTKNPDMGPVIRCYTCHSVHGSDVDKLLPSSQTDLCNQCHRKDTTNMVTPNPDE